MTRSVVVPIILFGCLAACQRTNDRRRHVADSQDRSAFQQKSSVFLGTQYYRTPNPRPEDWDWDFRRIREHGLDLVRFWVHWSKVNPAPGRWDWSDYDGLFDAAEKNGLKVQLLLVTELPPAWYMAAHPDTRLIESDGRPLASTPCFHHAQARSAGEEFMRRVAQRYRTRRSLHSYDVWNEVVLYACHCPDTQVLYCQWLQSRFKNIEALNHRYADPGYSSFSDVKIPTGGMEFYDYRELFFEWAREQELRWRVKTIQAADPGHVTMAHACVGFTHPVFWRADLWRLTRALDRWGTSIYWGDTNGHRSLTAEDTFSTALDLNAIRDTAMGKPWWLAETTAGRVFGGLGFAQRSDAEVRMKMVLALAYGAEAIVFWQWRPEIFGSESPNFGLTGVEGEPTSRSETVRHAATMLRNYRAVFDRLQWPPPKVGILFDPRGAIHEGGAGEKSPGWRNFLGFYRALTEEGYDIGILSARVVGESGVPAGIKVIFAPFLLFDQPELAAKLSAWVERGGTLVAGPRFGAYDIYGYAGKRVPPAGYAGVFEVRSREIYYPESAAIQLKSGGPLKTPAEPLEGHLLVETYETGRAETLGTFHNEPAFTTNRFGQGRGIMFGSFFGVPYPRLRDARLTQIVAGICQASGVSPDARSGEGIIVRVAHAGADAVLFLVNPFETQTTATITLNRKVHGTAVELLTGRFAGRIVSGKPLRVSLEGHGAQILLAQVPGGASN